MTELPPVEELLPHRGALRWIDAVELEASDRLRCQAQIRADNPFLVDRHLPALTLCELLSQAGAALVGIEARRRDERVGPGYLVSIRELDLSRAEPVPVGASLTVRVRAEARHADAAGEYCELRGEIARGSRPLATGELALLRLPSGGPAEPRGVVGDPLAARGDGPLRGLCLDEIRLGAEALSARLEVASACPLFADHFPGHPVLPAIAELLVVAWAARRAGWLEGEPRAVGRTKFLRPIPPASVLELALRNRGGGLRWSLSDGATVASGELLLPTRA
jgi:predicted hotdog family 3-hydroxylacyl-ACP dehydratase